MSVYRRKSGRWAVLVDADQDAAGKRVRRTLGTFSTRKDAERAEREALTMRDNGIDLVPTTVSIATLVERFIDDREVLGRGAKTIEEYRRNATLYVNPYLGQRSVAKLRPAHVTEWVATLLRGGGVKGRALSAKTVRHAFTLLSASLRWAVRMQLAGRNVCEAVNSPRVARSEAKALSAAELIAVLNVARETRWAAFATLALALGARRGELCAVTWLDVDLVSKTIAIRKSVSQTKATVALKSTKSGHTRILPLSRLALEALEWQRAMQVNDRRAAGRAYEDGDSVFTDALGARVTPKAATNAFARIAVKAKISTTRLHDLRHTTATTLLTSGVDVRTTAGVLGHVNPNVTLSVYAHLVVDTQRDAVEKLGATLDLLTNGNRMATAALPAKKKARNDGLFMVAGTGFEPVTFGL
jgi:integrase